MFGRLLSKLQSHKLSHFCGHTWQSWISVCVSPETLHSFEEHPAEHVRVFVVFTRPHALPSQKSYIPDEK